MLFRIQAKDAIGIVQAQELARDIERAAERFKAHVAYAKGTWSRVELAIFEPRGGSWRRIRYAKHKGGGHWKFGGKGI